MKQWLDALKSARKIEVLIIGAAICIALVLWMGGEKGISANDEEARMAAILSEIEGAGRVTVMISRDDENQIRGAVVAASGADDIRVILEIQQAVKTLTGLELENIEVVKSKG